MDLIAIPDFAAGAMENWGLVTYRETCLLVDEKETSSTAKQWVGLFIFYLYYFGKTNSLKFEDCCTEQYNFKFHLELRNYS